MGALEAMSSSAPVPLTDCSKVGVMTIVVTIHTMRINAAVAAGLYIYYSRCYWLQISKTFYLRKKLYTVQKLRFRRPI
jgi:hypothetical protein